MVHLFCRLCCDNLNVFQVRIHKFIEENKSFRSKKTEAGIEDALNDDKEKQRKYVNGLIKSKRLKEVQVVLKEEESSPWSHATQAKVSLNVIL